MRVLFFLLAISMASSYTYPQENELAIYDAGIAEFKIILKQQNWEKADINIASFCDQEYAEDFYHDLVITRINFLSGRALEINPQNAKYVTQLEKIRDQMPDPEMVEGVAEKMGLQCK